nr:prolyl oligopeptidase family serine peptidase [Tessaracoccus coleopterorum]
MRDEAFVGISTIDTPTVSFHVSLHDLRIQPLPEPAPARRRAELVEVNEPGRSKDHTITRHRAPPPTAPQSRTSSSPPTATTRAPPTLLYGYGASTSPSSPTTARLVCLARRRRRSRPGQPPRRRGVRLHLVRRRPPGQQAERVRRLHRRCRTPHRDGGHHLAAVGDLRPLQRGLLVGASLTQRPDLFAAALSTVGVLDVVKFHKFTVGAAWISDYGDPDTPDGFAAAHAYSPLHRIEEGVEYPPTMILTADHDDRVVPLHSFNSPRRCSTRWLSLSKTPPGSASSPQPVTARASLSTRSPASGRTSLPSRPTTQDLSRARPTGFLVQHRW